MMLLSAGNYDIRRSRPLIYERKSTEKLTIQGSLPGSVAEKTDTAGDGLAGAY